MNNVPSNDFVIQIATVNGSGSQSANNILVRTLFRMGVPVGGKNLFPSNIQGLPTWFTIRAHPQGFVSRRSQSDIFIGMNSQTILEDQKQLKAGGLFLVNSDLKFDRSLLRADVTAVEVPTRDFVEGISDSVKLKKLLVNMSYVGVLAHLLDLDLEVLRGVIDDQFGHKAQAVQANQKVMENALAWAKTLKIKEAAPWRAEPVTGGNDGNILIDGNSASAMGLLFGGCTVAAWYPITPSSSLVETFEQMAHQYRRDSEGSLTVAVLQAEDELASICMVIGAGWAGARAMTATSGPGLSLMAEAAGLSYFAEIPAVIWDVQRAGPSTGLPTRTMQGDVLAAAHLSHGDTKHVLLFPANPLECFEFGQLAFDLAEELQTLVIVLSDLDLGMNLHCSPAFSYPTSGFCRGKVLSSSDLDRLGAFARYKDVDGTGVGARTLPGTEHPKAAYFTRGTGHDETSRYSENPHHFSANLDRLKQKWQTAKGLVPKPILTGTPQGDVGIVVYGTSNEIIPELLSLLSAKGLSVNVLRLRAYPFSAEINAFVDGHERIYLIEQNRDAQMKTLLIEELSNPPSKIRSVLRYNGWPLDAMDVAQEILQREGLA